MVGQNGVLDSEPVMQVTRPPILVRYAYDSSSHGVQFDVTHTGEPITFVMNKRRLVSGFPKSAAPLVPAIKKRYIASPQCLHQVRHRLFGFRRPQQVHVVPHERIRVHFERVALAFKSKDGQEYPVIGWRLEYHAPIDATLRDMPAETWNEESRSTRHDS
jgi:hypothetical protein